MKKVLFIAAVAGLSLVSCKKDYTCECTVTSNGQSVSGSGATGKMSKKDAEAKCNEGDRAETTVSGISSKTECTIK